MKKVRCITLVFIFLLLLSSIFANEGYKEDYIYLWEKLESSYPLLPIIKELGVDIDKLKEEGIERAATSESEFAFKQTLDYLFNKLLRLDHLQFVNIEKENSKNETEVKPVVVSYYPEIKTVIFSLSSFGGNRIEYDQNLIEKTLNKYNDVENIIFDITSNRGGLFSYIDDVLLKPFGGIWEEVVPIYVKDPEGINAYIPNLKFERVEDPPLIVKELGLEYVTYQKRGGDYGEGTLDEKYKKAKRWVLTSGGTYSAGDKVASFCRDTGWATVVGENTSGCGEGLFIIFTLPNTGLIIKMGGALEINKEGKVNNIYGTPPDIRAKKGKTALSTVLDLIRNI